MNNKLVEKKSKIWLINLLKINMVKVMNKDTLIMIKDQFKVEDVDKILLII